MAQGDVTLFDYLLSSVESGYDYGSLSVRCALITASITPTATDNAPRFTAGGGTNYKTAEVTASGSYAADGASLSATFSRSADSTTGVLDFETNATWSQAASNPAAARWGIVYINTTNKPAIGFVDLGSAFDMTTGDLTITWNASGFMTVTRA